MPQRVNNHVRCNFDLVSQLVHLELGQVDLGAVVILPTNPPENHHLQSFVSNQHSRMAEMSTHHQEKSN